MWTQYEVLTCHRTEVYIHLGRKLQFYYIFQRQKWFVLVNKKLTYVFRILCFWLHLSFFTKWWIFSFLIKAWFKKPFSCVYIIKSTTCLFVNWEISLFHRWVIFNDQKVCASEKPPKDLGYLYFYRRVAEWDTQKKGVLHFGVKEEKRGR